VVLLRGGSAGARKRRLPRGGAAYRRPRYWFTPAWSCTPWYLVYPKSTTVPISLRIPRLSLLSPPWLLKSLFAGAAAAAAIRSAERERPQKRILVADV